MLFNVKHLFTLHEYRTHQKRKKNKQIRVYLKCGLWQEALYRQRAYSRSDSEEEQIRSKLVPLILEHVYVNRAPPPQQKQLQVQDDEDKMDEDDEEVSSATTHCSVLDLPLNEKEGNILISFLEGKIEQGDHRAADLLVSLHLHHCRIDDALATHEKHLEIIVSSSLSDALRQRIQTRRVRSTNQNYIDSLMIHNTMNLTTLQHRHSSRPIMPRHVPRVL